MLLSFLMFYYCICVKLDVLASVVTVVVKFQKLSYTVEY